ncbi:MAG: hypothetical protein A3E38_01975 [Candidatus Moranbacteria bacterium RIFCSPHIGHO2_12_FULL_54_9]|nr:MAG: hypothetical protein A3E38_01975 [Candidatus Moranbacteria bacterium RIFCSPHIGHO2_12_FULL_54_9]
MWRKSVNLYLSFLAFTDEDRPLPQLERAMACAIASAIYDYDSDHEFGNRKGYSFKAVLNQLIHSEPAKEEAIRLFEIDTAHALTPDGLERGSKALRFYRVVIAARWMQVYSDAEIDCFGRQLQMVDDLLDLESDRLAGDTNCFLDADRQNQYVTEVREFIESEFFRLLQARSRIYRTIKRKAEAAARQFGGTVTLKQLIATGRPHTGLYAFLLCLVSFGFFGWNSWATGLFTGVVFGLLTMSIMTFNDYVDRKHDVKKGKTFARDHHDAVLKFWYQEALVLLGLLAGLACIVPHVALFCLVIWFVGLLYSFIPHWFLLQNILVAVCSGSPALCGMISAGVWDYKSLATFMLFTCLILFNEINKDIEDHKIDRGYKSTVPVKLGTLQTSLLLIASLPVVSLPFLLHPNRWVLLVGLVVLPNIAFQQAYTLLHPKRVKRPIKAVSLAIKLLGVVLYLKM